MWPRKKYNIIFKQTYMHASLNHVENCIAEHFLFGFFFLFCKLTYLCFISQKKNKERELKLRLRDLQAMNHACISSIPVTYIYLGYYIIICAHVEMKTKSEKKYYWVFSCLYSHFRWFCAQHNENWGFYGELYYAVKWVLREMRHRCWILLLSSSEYLETLLILGFFACARSSTADDDDDSRLHIARYYKNDT